MEQFPSAEEAIHLGKVEEWHNGTNKCWYHMQVTLDNGAHLRYTKDIVFYRPRDFVLDRVQYSNGDKIVFDLNGRVTEIVHGVSGIVFSYALDRESNSMIEIHRSETPLNKAKRLFNQKSLPLFDLCEALSIFSASYKYRDSSDPLICVDQMLLIDPEILEKDVIQQHQQVLRKLGFEWMDQYSCWGSSRYGVGK